MCAACLFYLVLYIALRYFVVVLLTNICCFCLLKGNVMFKIEPRLSDFLK